MEILTIVRRLYIRFKSLVNDFVYSFGRAALLLLVEVQNHTVPVRERRRVRVNDLSCFVLVFVFELLCTLDPHLRCRFSLCFQTKYSVRSLSLTVT